VRSTDLLRPSDAGKAINGVVRLVQPGPWIELSKSCGLDTFQRPATAGLVVLMTVLLIVFQSRLRSRFRSLCVVSSGSTSLKMWPTFQGVLLAAAIAGPWPLLLMFAGWRITSVDGTPDLGVALGWGLIHVAILFWFSQFTRQI